MRITLADLDELTEDEIESLSADVAELLAVWQIKNLSGQARVFHDDQHIGEPRRELHAVQNPSVDTAKLDRFRSQPVVDNLEGNSLIHTLTTPIVEIDRSGTRARAVWWSIGLEALSKFREVPTAIWSMGVVPGTFTVEDGEWRFLDSSWQRTVKAEFHAGWVQSMIATNTRPPLTPEQDRQFLGRYAYRKDEVRAATPEPPAPDTWLAFPDEDDRSWMSVNLGDDRPPQP